MPPTSKRNSLTLARHRRRLRDQGFRRLEVRFREEDVPLLRSVAAALTDPDCSSDTRALLLARFASLPTGRFMDLLAAAPLDGIDLTRVRDTGRPVDLWAG